MNFNVRSRGISFAGKLTGLILLLLTGCSLEKKNFVNRNLQNLTAHYNILFNAKQLLAKKEAEYASAFVDNYNNMLNVYPDTIANASIGDKDLDEVMVKANKIINQKEQSHYLGDAYLLLGQANYLGGNYFNADAYFNYVIKAFPQQLTLTQEARAWKARSLIYLNQAKEATAVIDTALKSIDTKKYQAADADLFAVELQTNIATSRYTGAEEAAKTAISCSNIKSQKLRLTFILAQLQELNNEPSAAWQSYTTIIKSNAGFEMAFNASLNRIRIEDMANGKHTNRIERLKALLKNPNNIEFADQIYYQMAGYYAAKNDISNAIKNYRLSAHYSQKNQTQKGLAYLKIAEINFKTKADYIDAKKYYDSTLTFLPPNYPGYAIIQKKSANLQLLSDRYRIIATEDTLQMLAKLNDNERAKRIDQLVEATVLGQQNNVNTINTDKPGTVQEATTGKSNFYFYNTSAVAQGISEFKRIWGNRKSEDDWRRSNRQTSNITANTNTSIQSLDPDAVGNQQQKTAATKTATAYRQQLMDGLPLSPLRLQQSDERIFNAYLDIANFYRDELGDKNEAITIYENLLHRFPDHPDRPAIYYNLYRLYSDQRAAAAEGYKTRLLKEFPETVYAKIIIDPDYARRVNDKDAELNGLYDRVYDWYRKRHYDKTIKSADSLLQRYPGNKYAAQLLYLRTLAAGHGEKLEPFEEELQNIINTYPNDHLIVPLVMQHFEYIKANMPELAARPLVLPPNDSLENPFTPIRKQQVLKSSETFKPVTMPAITQQPVKKQAPLVSPPVKTQAPKTRVISDIFSMRDSSHYYFVVNVSSGTANLASSRFGFGQFNRANFPPNSIKHNLLSVGADNQLIYIGRFFSLQAVKDYARAIIPLLPEIMKVPADKYTFFIITKENLDKLAGKKTLDSYLDYYQSNY
jgi:tetratricopeptide (TPR) repeat protein